MSGQRRNIYVAASALVALAALAWALPSVPPLPAVAFLSAVAISEAFGSNFRSHVHVSLTNVVVLVAIVTGGPEMAVLASLGCVPVVVHRIVRQQRRRKETIDVSQVVLLAVVKIAFNVSQLVLSAAASGLVYLGIGRVLPLAFVNGWFLVAVAAAAITFTVVNHLQVATVVTLSSTESFRSVFRSLGLSMMLQVPYVGIAVLALVIMERASPWALALMAVPVIIARYGLLAFQRLDESYEQLVTSFVNAIEIKDLYTRGHSQRVSELSVHVAEELGVPYEERRLTRYAALLHDVGKVGVPLCIINKPGPLDDDEFAEIQKHPSIGAEILRDIDFLEPALDIVRFHHERLDGRGYPHGVGEDELSNIVRIVTAVDAFDAMTSTRSYRRAMTVADAIAELRRCAGNQFDPRMVEALATAVERIGWEPTIEFASEAELHGHEIPVGTAQERIQPKRESVKRSW